uniref:cytochrome c oxidase subunit NDUFA4-like n=1 Tax=Myxine glutinosa TaxID=7769 RepID=UPI00358EEA45
MLRLVYSQGKKHPSIIPLFFCMALGMSGAMAYMLRIALFSPDCSWDKRKNPEPWNKLKPTDQYKFLSISTDYSKLKKNGPDF